MEKVVNFFDKKFVKCWLLHALALWLMLIITSTGTYIYTSLINGSYHIRSQDGTPVTGFQYFLSNDIHWVIIITLLIIAFSLEFNYKWVVQKIDTGILYVLKVSLLFASFIALYYLLVIFRAFNFFVNIPDTVAVMFVYMIYALGYIYIRHSIENQKKMAQLRYQKSQAELDALKAQLNPHFFFNSLNNLYGTALQENAPKTVGMIEQLSSIMRYTMSEAQNSFTDIKNELDFIENYWALQEIRLPKKENIRLSKQLFFDEKPTNIAPLLLIPFIENAFKYGSSIDKDCKIDLDLSVENHQLQMVLSNTIQHDKTLEAGNGIGIENTKKRLDLIYGNRYTLKQNQEMNIYKTILTIQLT